MPLSPTVEELREENIAELFPLPSTHPTTSATASPSLLKETPSLPKETPSSAKKAFPSAKKGKSLDGSKDEEIGLQYYLQAALQPLETKASPLATLCQKQTNYVRKQLKSYQNIY